MKKVLWTSACLMVFLALGTGQAYGQEELRVICPSSDGNVIIMRGAVLFKDYYFRPDSVGSMGAIYLRDRDVIAILMPLAKAFQMTVIENGLEMHVWVKNSELVVVTDRWFVGPKVVRSHEPDLLSAVLGISSRNLVP